MAVLWLRRSLVKDSFFHVGLYIKPEYIDCHFSLYLKLRVFVLFRKCVIHVLLELCETEVRVLGEKGLELKI